MPTVIISELSCQTPEDFSGDEALLKIFADGVLRSVQTSSDPMKAGHSLSFAVELSFQNSLKFELWDLDVPPLDAHDLIKSVEVPAATLPAGESLQQLSGDGAIYTVRVKQYIPPAPPTQNPPGQPQNQLPPGKEDQMKAALEKLMSDHLCGGNEGKAYIEEFSYANGVVKFKIRLKHQHDFGSLFPGAPSTQLGPVNTYVQGEFNPYNPSSISQIEICTDIPSGFTGGHACVSLGQIAAALAA